MDEGDRDTRMCMAAFEHVRRLGEVHDHLTNDAHGPVLGQVEFLAIVPVGADEPHHVRLSNPYAIPLPYGETRTGSGSPIRALRLRPKF